MSDTGLLWMLFLSSWVYLFIIAFKIVRMEDKLRSSIIKERIAREKALLKIQKEINYIKSDIQYIRIGPVYEVMNGKYEPSN